MAVKTLILWTGGVESTSILKWMLETTSEDIHAHYIVMKNMELRSWHEDGAIRRLLNDLRGIRHFSFSVSSVAVCQGHALMPDHWLYFPIGVAAAQHHKCDRILRGWSAEDDWDRFVNSDGSYRYEAIPAGMTSKWLRHMEVLRAFINKPTEVYCPLMIHHHWTKAQHVKYLGDMAKETWSCRRPKNGRECGECFSCACRAAAFNGTSAIKEIADQMRVQE